MKKVKDGNSKAIYRGASIADVVKYVHEEIVRECEYCGKAMTRSDIMIMDRYVSVAT